ncbi:hypothetical protein [Flavobacterium sp.]|uniref:hypothetical protein n=1 Tax=Flavobacterium sp. TaxID=239 RepID=UPI00374FDD5E
MKNLLFSLIAIVLLSITGNAQANFETVLSNINLDITNKKYYPNETNKFDFNSKKLKSFMDSNEDLLNGVNSENTSEKLKVANFKEKIVEYLNNNGFSKNEVSQEFDKNLIITSKYDNFNSMLEDYVDNNIISKGEKNIIEQNINYFFSTKNFNDYDQINNIFIHHINISNLTESEKKEVLTFFDGLKLNKDLMESNSKFKYLSFFQDDLINLENNGKPTRSTRCAGHMLMGMLGGSIGGPAGFAAGFIGGFWACYVDGCFD